MAHTSRCETADPDSRCECSCGGDKHGIANDNTGGSTAGGTSDDEINSPEVDARIFRNLGEGDAFDFHFVNRDTGNITGGGTFRIKEWFSDDEAILENPESEFEESVRVGSNDHLLYYEGDQLAGTLGNIRPVGGEESDTSRTPQKGVEVVESNLEFEKYSKDGVEDYLLHGRSKHKIEGPEGILTVHTHLQSMPASSDIARPDRITWVTRAFLNGKEVGSDSSDDNLREASETTARKYIRGFHENFDPELAYEAWVEE